MLRSCMRMHETAGVHAVRVFGCEVLWWWCVYGLAS